MTDANQIARLQAREADLVADLNLLKDLTLKMAGVIGVLEQARLSPERWIPVSEALPPEESDGESDVVLVWPRERLNTVYQRLGVYNYRKQRWDYPSSTGYALEMPVTHWMPMPPGPA